MQSLLLQACVLLGVVLDRRLHLLNTRFAGGEAVYNVGGGVVFDSTAEGEYEEAMLKARFAMT